LAFAVPAFLLTMGGVVATWLLAPSLLPMQGVSWSDATYPITAAASSALVAYAGWAAFGGKITGRVQSAFLGAAIALVSFYLTCVHAGAALLLHKGDERWWLDAWGAGIWAYLFWSFVGLWGLGVPVLGAVVGWRTYPLLVIRHLPYTGARDPTERAT
jgi:hypothetical protein